VIKTAIDRYGRIDILINNAGISATGSFWKRKDEEWNKTIDTHLLGAFKCTSAAWGYMREQGYGRILNTTSPAGLYGAHGLVDYSTAKSGINGATMSLAIEGAKRNIKCNSIAPLADTRMLRALKKHPVMDVVPAKLVVPLMALLVHESCKPNGAIFECGGGWVSQVRWQRAEGVRFDPDHLTAEKVRDHFKQICSFDGRNEYPSYDPNWGHKVTEWMQKSKL
jgi:(3R)-3-hydroxyacyl-CoA dehydrogenase / 3a,7a,12a-trihydroxy-5b-cholest-24-enoyl-CoA hydratase / enoyl-CoA hydratase 2